MTRDDQGVSTVVGALLVLAAVVVFLAVYNLTWVPTIEANREGAQSLELRQALASWGDAAEGLVARGLTNRTFTQALPVGASGSGFTGTGGFTGIVTLQTAPTLTVSNGASTLADLSGALQAESRHARQPTQVQRYAFGAIEVEQGGHAWVDLRGLLSAQRVAGGLVGLAVQAVGLTGGAQSQGGAAVDVVGTVESAAATTPGAGTIRFVAAHVAAAGWRAAAQRTLEAAGLAGETSATCDSSTLDWCLDATTNTASDFDLRVRNVRASWTQTVGVVRVELRV